jgi:transcriptional regulator with XRE-family HTH domain
MAAKSKWGVNIQKEVRGLMRKHNLSLEDVASRLGVSARSIYRWERGESLPKSRFTVREFEKLKQELEKK